MSNHMLSTVKVEYFDPEYKSLRVRPQSASPADYRFTTPFGTEVDLLKTLRSRPQSSGPKKRNIHKPWAPVGNTIPPTLPPPSDLKQIYTSTERMNYKKYRLETPKPSSEESARFQRIRSAQLASGVLNKSSGEGFWAVEEKNPLQKSVWSQTKVREKHQIPHVRGVKPANPAEKFKWPPVDPNVEIEKQRRGRELINTFVLQNTKQPSSPQFRP